MTKPGSCGVNVSNLIYTFPGLEKDGWEKV